MGHRARRGRAAPLGWGAPPETPGRGTARTSGIPDANAAAAPFLGISLGSGVGETKSVRQTRNRRGWAFRLVVIGVLALGPAQHVVHAQASGCALAGVGVRKAVIVDHPDRPPSWRRGAPSSVYRNIVEVIDVERARVLARAEVDEDPFVTGFLGNGLVFGNRIGVYDRRQCRPGCLVPCEPKIEGGEGVEFASMMQILDDLKAARTQEDFVRVTMAYRERLLLNASRRMVLALDGCSGGPLVPVSMVLVSPDQVDTLQKLKMQSLEGYLAASSG